MAFDAEWHQLGNRNHVLSYQIATVSESKSNNIIEYTIAGKRLFLAEIVKLGLRSILSEEEFSNLRRKKVSVVLCSHNLTAEWSVLADRTASNITKYLGVIRSQPTTGMKPIKIEIDDVIAIRVHLFDTMLLAPNSHRSLKSLSKLLGDIKEEKEQITQYYIENMHRYLFDHPDEFEKYALKDSKITIMIFFLIQDSLNKLVKNFDIKKKPAKFKLYRTLASAGVASFKKNTEKYDEYRKILKGMHERGNYLIKNSYYGGRNESYFIGRTNNYHETKNKIWLDVDFIGCYPTAMSICPKIDINGKIEYRGRKYSFNDDKIKVLKEKNIPEEIIQEAREALSKSTEAFDEIIMNIQDKKQSWEIRKIIYDHDNSLIDEWYNRWKTEMQSEDPHKEWLAIPGFARIFFRFPHDTCFPCLPIWHEKYGLIYPLEGTTVVTAVEIILALDAGCEIKALESIQYPIKMDNDRPVLFLMDHLAKLVQKRNEYKSGEDESSAIMERLLKEFANSLYGKFSQSINPKESYNPATGEMDQLRQSPITEPCIAALTTSTARAALSAGLMAIEKFNQGKVPDNQITLISATTDGFLIGLPAFDGVSVKDKYYEENPLRLRKETEKQLKKILTDYGCSEFWDILGHYLPIRQMRYAREAMTSNENILEIKHIADEIISIKTRGQIGKLNSGETVLLARFNLKPPLSDIIPDSEQYKKIMEGDSIERHTVEADWILKMYEKYEGGDRTIQYYNFYTLNKFNAIYKSENDLDLTRNRSLRIINFSYDWKRKIVTFAPDDDNEIKTSPFTVPHINIKEMLQHRDKSIKILKEGTLPTPIEVLKRFKLSKSPVNRRGGTPAALGRLFLRALVQKKLTLSEELPSYQECADKMNEIWQSHPLTQGSARKWTKDMLKKAAKDKWDQCHHIRDKLTVDLIRLLAESFGANKEETCKLIFDTQEEEVIQKHLLEYVLIALSQAHEKGLYPFTDLHKNGAIDRNRVENYFSAYFSPQKIESISSTPFISKRMLTTDRDVLIKIFHQVGLSAKNSEECTKILIEDTRRQKHKFNKSNRLKCAKSFISAITDSNKISLNLDTITNKLSAYGIDYDICKKQLRKRFQPNSIEKNSENIKQIKEMSKIFDTDYSCLIEKMIKND